MKRLPVISVALVLIAAVAAFASLHCDGNPSSSLLAATIISQPVGGTGITTVSCTFKGTSWRADGEPGELDEPVIVTTVWHSSHGTYNRQTFTWTQHDQTQTFTTSKSASAGTLDKPFWLVIEWADKDGTNRVYSDTAYCE